MKRGKFTISDFYCTCCGNLAMPIARKVGKEREKGHLKKLYCYHCRCEQNCAEVRPFGEYTKAEFDKEFSAGNFVAGQRIQTFKQAMSLSVKEGI